jgi:hypothetical protein
VFIGENRWWRGRFAASVALPARGCNMHLKRKRQFSCAAIMLCYNRAPFNAIAVVEVVLYSLVHPVLPQEAREQQESRRRNDL